MAVLRGTAERRMLLRTCLWLLLLLVRIVDAWLVFMAFLFGQERVFGARNSVVCNAIAWLKPYFAVIRHLTQQFWSMQKKSNDTTATSHSSISSVSFCGCSWLMMYHCGVAAAISSKPVSRKELCFYGASSGSLVACALTVGIAPSRIKNFAIKLARESRCLPLEANVPGNEGFMLAGRTKTGPRKHLIQVAKGVDPALAICLMYAYHLATDEIARSPPSAAI